MKKLSLNQKGFGLVGVLIVIVVLVVLGGAGAYVYHRDHKAKTTTSSNHSTQTANNNTTKANNSSTTSKADPYAGWKTYSDTTYHYSFKYPSDWTLTATATTKVGDTGGASLLNPAKTVQVTYSNAYTQDSGTIAFTPSYISKPSSANEDLTIVGGYSPAGQWPCF
jgi:Tfp pilus assembly protein PilV